MLKEEQRIAYNYHCMTWALPCNLPVLRVQGCLISDLIQAGGQRQHFTMLHLNTLAEKHLYVNLSHSRIQKGVH